MRLSETIKNTAKVLTAIALFVYALPKIWAPISKITQIAMEMTWEEKLVGYLLNMLILKALLHNNPTSSETFARDRLDQAQQPQPSETPSRRPPSPGPAQ